MDLCINDWGIDTYVLTFTVDNASSNDVAAKYLKDKILDKNGLILNGDFFHMRCTTHIRNLIVKDGLYEVKYSISCICDLVKYVKSSLIRA